MRSDISQDPDRRGGQGGGGRNSLLQGSSRTLILLARQVRQPIEGFPQYTIVVSGMALPVRCARNDWRKAQFNGGCSRQLKARGPRLLMGNDFSPEVAVVTVHLADSIDSCCVRIGSLAAVKCSHGCFPRPGGFSPARPHVKKGAIRDSVEWIDRLLVSDRHAAVQHASHNQNPLRKGKNNKTIAAHTVVRLSVEVWGVGRLVP